MGFLRFFYQYISNISDIYNPNKNMSLAYQTKCKNMLTDPESDHKFSYFCFLSYVPGYIFSLLVSSNFPLTLKR